MSYCAFLYADSYGHHTRSHVHSTHMNKMQQQPQIYVKKQQKNTIFLDFSA